MKKFRFSLNLQLFSDSVTLPNGDTYQIDPAELEDNDNDFGIEVDGDDEELQTDETDDGADGEEGNQSNKNDKTESQQENVSGEEQEEVTGQKKEQNPVAKAVIAERKKWQAKLEEANKSNPLLQKLMKLSGITSMEQLQAQLDAAEAATIAKAQNITPEQAQLQLQQHRKQEQMERKLRDLEYENEAQKLMQDPFFADLSEHREEFQEIAARTGLTLEEVYMSKRGKVRMKEMEREIEARLQANQDKKQKQRVDTSANGAQTKTNKVNLNDDQMAIARKAVRMGHFKSVEEYAKFMKK